MTKDELRKKYKNIRKIMVQNGELQEISRIVTKNILNSNLYKTSLHIALYYPLKSEIDITGIVSSAKNFYLPRCKGDDLEFVKYNNNLTKGAFSLLEPQGNAINPNILDVIYIPAICCDKKCNRIGWGRGYYDRFFNSYKIKAKKVIVTSKHFIIENVVSDNFDYTCDSIIYDDIC